MKQYVGARYVPKLYTNSLDPSSCEWESGVAYEPLTIVTYNYSSYISRVPVAGTVGNPPANPDYWAETGSYNGQIANLQNQIDALSAGLQDSVWHNKKIVVYGDSLSMVAHNYWQYMVEKDPTIDITNRAEGGTRIQDGVTLLQAATDLNTYDIIVLAYGTNSWANTSMREMVNSYVTAFNEILGDAPNAQVICIAPPYAYRPDFGVSTINDLHFGIYDYGSAIVNVATNYGFMAYNLYDLSGVNQYNYSELLEESAGGIYLHETEELGRRIADQLLLTAPMQQSYNSHRFIQVGDNPNIGINVDIIQNMFFISQKGTITIADLQNTDFNHIAPNGTIFGMCRGATNYDAALVGLSATGTWTFSFPVTDDTKVQGIVMFGSFANNQPR